MRRIVFSLACALVGAIAVALSVKPAPTVVAEAGTPSTFLIPQSDGYGLGECLAEGRECGKIVANAWCESKGFTRAASYGLASPADFTGSVSSRPTTPAQQPLMISCET